MRREDIVKALFYSSVEGTCDNRCSKDTSINECEECTSIMFAEYEKELIEDFIKFATNWLRDKLCNCNYAEYYWLLKDLSKIFMEERPK